MGTAPIKEQVIHFVNKKLPGGLPKKTARALLDIEDKDYVPIIRNPQATTADTEAVFYFPGCGSERLFSQVGLATQAMLWHAGVQTVLPPGYLCCGYPQRGNGQFDKAEKMITDNRVLFHRVANTLNYLDIKTVVVSCGTCYDQLQGYQFDKIFPGCRIIDIHEYLLEKGITLPEARARYLYHEPCHNPMKQQDSMKTVRALVGDAGAQERPLLRRIRHAGRDPARCVHPGALPQGRGNPQGRSRCCVPAAAVGAQDNVKILTSCPSCLQGLTRYAGRPVQRPAGSRLHRDRDGQADPGRELAARVRAHAPTPAASSGCWYEPRLRTAHWLLPLVTPTAAALVWRGAKLRVIRAQEAGFPAFYRVIWTAHVAEFSDLSAADRAHCMEAVTLVEQALREHLAPTKINLASAGQRGAAPALARDRAL